MDNYSIVIASSKSPIYIEFAEDLEQIMLNTEDMCYKVAITTNLKTGIVEIYI